MKGSTIQCQNVNRGHAITIIVTNVQNVVPLHRHKPGSVSFCQSPHQQLSVVRQTRPHSDAAAVGLSKVSKVIQSAFVYPFVADSFTDLLAPNLQTHTDFKK